MRRKLAAGNWKMNGNRASLAEIETLAADCGQSASDIMIAPPATLITQAKAAGKGAIAIGGQDCHSQAHGAHTGDISADMLADAGASHVILGHSERRADHGETSYDVRQKAEAAQAAGLIPVICVGESFEDREAGLAEQIVQSQLRDSLPDSATSAFVIAYEPIWAIGTGKVPSLDDIASMHNAIRDNVTQRFGLEIGAGMRLLYGGSVKPGNAAEIFAQPDVDGALVGGASLKASDFGAIIEALNAAS